MSHPKKQVRDAVDTVLSATPTNWSAVFKSRLSPERKISPFLLVYCEDESLEPITMHSPVTYDRDILLIVQGRKRVSNDIEEFEDSLDSIAEEIEQKLTLTTLQAQLSTVKRLILLSTTSEVLADDDDRVYASVQLNYAVRVNTLEGVPQTLI